MAEDIVFRFRFWRALGAALACALALGVITGSAQAAPAAKGWVRITSPTDGETTMATGLQLAGRAKSPTGTVSITVNGSLLRPAEPIAVIRGQWSFGWGAPLVPGTHVICAVVSTESAVLARDCITRTIVADPDGFEISYPTAGQETGPQVAIGGWCQFGTRLALTLDGTTVGTPLSCDSFTWSWSFTVSGLAVGEHTATVKVTTNDGTPVGARSVTWTVLATAP